MNKIKPVLMCKRLGVPLCQRCEDKAQYFQCAIIEWRVHFERCEGRKEDIKPLILYYTEGAADGGYLPYMTAAIKHYFPQYFNILNAALLLR
jgi:hypothetical protein